MSRQSLTLLSSTGSQPAVTGTSIRASGYYGNKNTLHTLAIYLNDFSGTIKFQATLLLTPENNDWFDIKLNTGQIELVYGYDPLAALGSRGTTDVQNFNFQGNFMNIRAVMHRNSLTTPEIIPYGQLNKILVNY